MAGLYFEPSRVGREAYEEMKLIATGITQGVLGPLFFIWIGLNVTFETITQIPLFIFLLVSIAFCGKLLGSGLPAYWLGLNRKEALAVGVGMSSRGAVEFIVLSIAFEAGLFANSSPDDLIVTNLFSALVLMVVVTTFLTLMTMRNVLSKSLPS